MTSKLPDVRLTYLSSYQTILYISFSRSTQVMMLCLLKLLALACCVITAAAECTSTKYNQGTRDWLKCSGASLTEVQAKLHQNQIAVSVSKSAIREIPNLAFSRNASALENLNFHDCGISRIGDGAFKGLMLLKKLSLPYNSIEKLNATWFYDLPLLEQLDVSFNKISELDSNIYFQLKRLQRLNLNDNLLGCIPKENMENMSQLKNIRIEENPLTYTCRAQLTLWLKDHQVSYATSRDNFIWLDSILWQCLSGIPTSAGATSSEVEGKMTTCAISKMFNQLITVLGASSSIETSTRECAPFRQSLTHCLRDRNVKTNGDMLMNILALTHDSAKEITH